MPYENDSQAAEALLAAIETDRGNEPAPAVTTQEVPAAQEQAEAPASGSEGTTDNTDSFTRADLAALLEGVGDPVARDRIETAYKSFQGDYTRSKQQLSEQAKAYEALEEAGGVDAALEAVRFATALSTDPQYALEVQKQLTVALTEAGLSPAEAAQEATRQVNEAASTTDDDDFDYEDNPLSKKLSSVESELEELRRWRAEQDEREHQIALSNELQRQENKILQDHTEYTDDDINNIYNLAYSTGGNLLKANETYQNIRNHVVEDYLARKSSVPSTSVPAGSSSAQAPTKVNGLFDPVLDSLVAQHLAEKAAAGEI